MGDRTYTLGPGELYINGEFFARIGEATVEEKSPTWAEDGPIYVSKMTPAEFSVSVELEEETARRLIGMSRELMCYAALIINEYPNRRVVHLAIRGKKKRTRKKNIKRLVKYAIEEAKR